MLRCKEVVRFAARSSSSRTSGPVDAGPGALATIDQRAVAQRLVGARDRAATDVEVGREQPLRRELASGRQLARFDRRAQRG